MNSDFLLNALNKTLNEFFTAFDSKVTNVDFQLCKQIFTNTTLNGPRAKEMTDPFKNKEFCKKIQEAIQEKDTALFDMESNEMVLFEKIAIKKWYGKLEEEEKELVWKYLKSLSQICFMLSKK